MKENDTFQLRIHTKMTKSNVVQSYGKQNKSVMVQDKKTQMKSEKES